LWIVFSFKKQLGRVVLCYSCVAIIIVNVVVHLIFFREPAVNVTNKCITWEPASASSAPSSKEKQYEQPRPRKQWFMRIFKIATHFCQPFRFKDYTLILISQLVFTLGFENITTFAIYYLNDKIGPVYTVIVWDQLATSAEQALAILMIIVLASGLTSSIVFGYMGDCMSRKWLMFASGVAELFGCIFLAIFKNYNIVLACGFFLGIGIGGINAIYVGLALDIVQDKTPSQVAQNMAILSALCGVLPKLLSNVVGGAAIAFGNELWKRGIVPIDQFGYNVMFIVSALLMTLGNILILFVNAKYGRPEYKNSKRQQQQQQQVQLEEEEMQAMGNDDDTAGEQTVQSPVSDDEGEGGDDTVDDSLQQQQQQTSTHNESTQQDRLASLVQSIWK